MKCPDCNEPMEPQEDLVWDHVKHQLVPGPTMWSCDACDMVFEERGHKLLRMGQPEPLDAVLGRR